MNNVILYKWWWVVKCFLNHSIQVMATTASCMFWLQQQGVLYLACGRLMLWILSSPSMAAQARTTL